MSTPDVNRAAFEAHFCTIRPHPDFFRRHDGPYYECSIELAWLSWQASRKGALEEAVAMSKTELEKYATGDHSSGVRGSFERRAIHEYAQAIKELLK